MNYMGGLELQRAYDTVFLDYVVYSVARRPVFSTLFINTLTRSQTQHNIYISRLFLVYVFVSVLMYLHGGK